MAKKKCPTCGRRVNGHPNKKFCGQKCRDRYHNVRNPRGKFEHLNPSSEHFDPLSDMHPFDSDNFNHS